MADLLKKLFGINGESAPTMEDGAFTDDEPLELSQEDQDNLIKNKLDKNKMVEQELMEANSFELPEEPEVRLPAAVEIKPQDKYSNLLQQYSQLKKPLNLAQDQSIGTRDANLFGAGAKVAQGLARTAGGQIDDAQDLVKNLKDQSQQLPKDLKEATELENEMQMNDPNSDISKFYRERAYKLLPNLQKGSVDTMTAKQLVKVLGNVGVDKTQRTDLLTKLINGKRYNVQYDPSTKGYFYKNESGEIVPYNDSTTRQVAYINPTTGAREYFEEGSAPPGYLPVASYYQNKNQGQLDQKDSKTKPDEVSQAEKDSIYLEKMRYKDPNRVKWLDDKQKEINAEKGINELKDAVGNISTAEEMVNKNLPGSGPMLSRALLSIYESGGKFTDQDVEQMKGPTDLKARMKRFLVTNFNPDQAVSETDQAAQMELLKLLKRKKTEQLSSKFYPHVNQLVTKGFDKDFATRYLSGYLINNYSEIVSPMSLSKSKISEQTPGQKQTNSGMVKMVTPNGKSILIPKENVDAAKKRGAKVVE